METFVKEYYNEVLITESSKLKLPEYSLQSSYRKFCSRKGAVKFGGLGIGGTELKDVSILINPRESALNDSVAVEVAGHLIGEGGLLKRKFTISLILQPNHTVGGYYILNETFRSLEDDEEDALAAALGPISYQNISVSYRTQPRLELEYDNDMVNNIMAQTTMISFMVNKKVLSRREKEKSVSDNHVSLRLVLSRREKEKSVSDNHVSLRLVDQVIERRVLEAIESSQQAAIYWTVMYGKKIIRIGWSSQDLNTLKLAVLAKKQTFLSNHESSSKKQLHKLLNLLRCAIGQNRILSEILGISEIDEISTITWLTAMTGLLGEFLVFTFLRVIYGEKNVKWINENEEKGEPHDILILPNKEVEVKATIVPMKKNKYYSFSVSRRQWQNAGEKKEYCSFAHVAFGEGRQARIRDFENPTRLVDEGVLLIKKKLE